MKYPKSIATALLFSLAIAASPVIAADIDIYAQVQSFTWKEFAKGSRLLKESGPIYGVGGSVIFPIRQFALKARGEIFGGSVDYEGETWGGEPVQTDSNYFGFKLEGDFGWVFHVTEGSSLEPFAGLGYRWWLRDLESTHEATGYLENWSSLYLRLGGRGDYSFWKSLNAFAEASLKFPIYNENTAYLGDVGLEDVTLNPGRRPWFFAEAGIKYALFRMSVFYEGMRFSRSRVVAIDDEWGVYQPKSTADIFGVNLGVSF